MVSPETIYKVMRSESKAVSVYGTAVGFLLKDYDKPYSEQSAVIYLNDEMIDNTRDQFKDIFSISTNWQEYKEKMKIIFTKQEDDYIEKRAIELRTDIKNRLI